MPPSSGGEAPGEITCGEAFAVLPFGNSTTIETLTYAAARRRADERLPAAVRRLDGGTGRTPQFSGLWVEFHCNGTVPVIDNVWLAPAGPAADAPRRSGPATPSASSPTTSCSRGGDGYTALTGGTDVLQTGDLLLDVLIEYIGDNSPDHGAPAGRAPGRSADPLAATGAMARHHLRHGPRRPVDADCLVQGHFLRSRFARHRAVAPHRSKEGHT